MFFRATAILYITFIERFTPSSLIMRKEFDHVSRHKLWEILNGRCVQNCVVEVTKNLFSETIGGRNDSGNNYSENIYKSGNIIRM